MMYSVQKSQFVSTHFQEDTFNSSLVLSQSIYSFICMFYAKYSVFGK